MGRPVQGAHVLVTGASSGIGAATAEALAAGGASVGLVARREDRLREVADRCRAHGVDAHVWVTDLGDLDRAVGVVHEAWDALGHLDVLVNNAAIPKRRDVRDLTNEELDDVMRVDFTSPARMSMAVLPRMLDRGTGTIVNVSSLGGRLGIIHETAYCAAKFALCGWTESMALDLWQTGIDVRLVIPGPIDTEIWHLPDNERSRYDGPLEPPSTVAADIIAVIEGDTFEVYSPDMKSIAEFKTAEIDTFLAGAATMGETGAAG
jgi:short-subunit dehydrogenase